MSIEEVLTSPDWVLPCPNGFPYPVKVLPHCIDGAVHIQKLATKIFFYIPLFRFVLLTDIFSYILCYFFPVKGDSSVGNRNYYIVYSETGYLSSNPPIVS
jgi:hypothetical protein